jgi:hypothetical protein
MVVTYRMEGDKFFFWILAVAILALCLLLGLMSAQ